MTLSVRKSIAEDVDHLQTCLDRDEYHKGQRASDWMQYGTLISFHSEIGPLYHVSLQQIDATRYIHFQHDPTISKRHLAVAMSKGINWLKAESKKEGVEELSFTSTVLPLIEFFIKHHGFVAVGHDEYKAGL
jgi:hypothetical protein